MCVVAFHVLGLREALEDTRLVAGRRANREVVVMQVCLGLQMATVPMFLLL